MDFSDMAAMINKQKEDDEPFMKVHRVFSNSMKKKRSRRGRIA